MALCAVTACYGLLSERPDDAGDLLKTLWCDVAATTPSLLLNESLAEITDRQQELSGNLSLNQELFFVRKVNDWVEKG